MDFSTWVGDFGTSLVITDYPMIFKWNVLGIRITALSVTDVIPFILPETGNPVFAVYFKMQNKITPK